jgi:hypothetical protein
MTVPYAWGVQCTQLEGRMVNPDKIASLGCDIGAVWTRR